MIAVLSDIGLAERLGGHAPPKHLLETRGFLDAVIASRSFIILTTRDAGPLLWKIDHDAWRAA